MKQTLTRLALTLPVVWLVVSLVFLLIHLVPGDPIQMMLGDGATSADIGFLRHQYGLELPEWICNRRSYTSTSPVLRSEGPGAPST